MAEEYGTRPSELLGIADPWAAFCVDEALFVRRRLWLQENEAGSGRYRPDGYDPPDRRALTAIPWGGPGADPLAQVGL